MTQLAVGIALLMAAASAHAQPIPLNPASLTRVGSSIFFTGSAADSGRELWKTDVSGFGVELVRDIAPGPASSSPYFLVDVDGTLFFGANHASYPSTAPVQLWKSDGQAAGTTQVTLLNRIEFSFDSPVLTFGRAPGGVLARLESLQTHGNARIELYSVEPANGQSAHLGTFYRGPASISTPFCCMTRYKDAFFFAGPGSGPGGLMRTDGTVAGTGLFKSLDLSSPRYVTGLAVLGERLLFTAWPGADTGLWSSDGTVAGTVRLLTDIAENGTLVASGGMAFLMASVGSGGVGLWKSDGTVAGTVLVKSQLLTSGRAPTGVDGTLFFWQQPATGLELWKSDGTPSGTVLVTPLAGGNPRNFAIAHKGRLFFNRSTAETGEELWVSDGTAAGTRMVKDIAPGASSSTPTELLSAGDFVFFNATDGVKGSGLWRTDGTEAGTVQVDGSVQVRVESAQGMEGSQRTSLMAFTVRLSMAATTDVTIQYATSDGTATAGSDYVATSGLVTILAGSMSRTIVVPVNGDTVTESDETFSVTLTSATGATITGSSASGTITNDDPAAAATTMPQYRLYHDGTKEHLYTTDLNEYTVLGANGWAQEGVAYRMLTNGVYNGVATIPFFRLYLPGILQHHWTTDANEASVLSSSWSYERTIGYVLPTPASGTTPLYRMSLASPPLHLWTTDLNEYGTLAARGWVKEGIVGYVLP